MRFLELFTEFISRNEIAAQRATAGRDLEHEYNEKAARLFHQGNDASAAGRPGDAFWLWRESGRAEYSADEAGRFASRYEGRK